MKGQQPVGPRLLTINTFIHYRPPKTKKKLHSIASLSLRNGKTVHRTTTRGKSSTTKVCREPDVVKANKNVPY